MVGILIQPFVGRSDVTSFHVELGEGLIKFYESRISNSEGRWSNQAYQPMTSDMMVGERIGMPAHGRGSKISESESLT